MRAGIARYGCQCFGADTGHRRIHDFYCRGALKCSVILRFGRVKEGKVWGRVSHLPCKLLSFFRLVHFYA